MKSLSIIVVSFSLIFVSCNDFDELNLNDNQVIHSRLDEGALNESRSPEMENEVEFLDCYGNIIGFGDSQ